MANNNIKEHVYWDTKTNKAYIECDICNSFIRINTNEDFTKAKNIFKVIKGKCYCNKCYKRYLDILRSNHVNVNCNDEDVFERPSKIDYYLNIAKTVASRSTCLRRKYGAIIVKDDSIISTGYNGSPRGTKNCIDLNECRREKLNIPRGQCYEMCRGVHAEQNCIINAKRSDMIGSMLYLYGINSDDNSLIENLDSCQLCKKLIINSGIEKVIVPRKNNKFEIINVKNWIDNDETLTDKFGY